MELTLRSGSECRIHTSSPASTGRRSCRRSQARELALRSCRVSPSTRIPAPPSSPSRTSCHRLGSGSFGWDCASLIRQRSSSAKWHGTSAWRSRRAKREAGGSPSPADRTGTERKRPPSSQAGYSHALNRDSTGCSTPSGITSTGQRASSTSRAETVPSTAAPGGEPVLVPSTSRSSVSERRCDPSNRIAVLNHDPLRGGAIRQRRERMAKLRERRGGELLGDLEMDDRTRRPNRPDDLQLRVEIARQPGRHPKRRDGRLPTIEPAPDSLDLTLGTPRAPSGVTSRHGDWRPAPSGPSRNDDIPHNVHPIPPLTRPERGPACDHLVVNRTCSCGAAMPHHGSTEENGAPSLRRRLRRRRRPRASGTR